jgi:polyhydroxybutyrate depolymerase
MGVAALLAVASCRGGAGAPPATDDAVVAARAAQTRTPSRPRGVLGGGRPVRVVGPERGLGGTSPRPLVLALHGYGDQGANFAAYLGYDRLAQREGFFLLAPDGTEDRRNLRFWNATDVCCNFFGARVDDVAYLRGLIREARAALPVDPRRVYIIGLSNGGFMAHRLACEAAPEIAAIVSIAGVTWSDAARCRPARAVSVLQVHPDADHTVLYAGGRDLLGLGGPPYPGAVTTVDRWAALDRCAGRRAPQAAALDLVEDEAGEETRVEVVSGCPAGIDVRLWTARGAPHVPPFGPRFAALSWRWLQEHPAVGPRR